jgi:putative spermidine/putrescine transport system ATP-binding protein
MRAFLGAATRLTLAWDEETITVLLPKGAPVPNAGDSVRLSWDEDALHIMEGFHG